MSIIRRHILAGVDSLNSRKLRVAFWSPMPPSKSGIADYSAALVSELGKLADVTVFDSAGMPYDPASFDVDLYHIGNNPHHTFVYDAALRRPGVVVMHEANLHHLIADCTIRRGDWDAYMAEVALNGTSKDLEFAQRVRALETGPDYEGVKMTRRLLDRSKAIIVHSQFMVDEMRTAGFAGPLTRIPHGSWMPEANGIEWRGRLGLDPFTPLVGAFGFIKPYKRIAESLRALRRIVRVDNRVRMILVGEPHPEFAVHDLIRSLGLEDHVRVLGFTPIEHFTGYMSACDVILNLRYPTVGESSGSMLRALGLGKPVLVSDVGAFSEFPSDVCLKVPPGDGEDDLIFEYLNLLISRPELAQSLGKRAREWVSQECNWPRAAALYASFLEAVHNGDAANEYAAPAVAALPMRSIDTIHGLHPPAALAAEPPVNRVPIIPEDITLWATDSGARNYIDGHQTRLLKTLELTPPGGPDDSILEMGVYFQITPSLKTKLAYGHVEGCYFGVPGTGELRRAQSAGGETFECRVEYFNAEKDRFPYQDGTFATVLCCELIEHLFEDPMFMMSEINRILRTGGHLVLTTPNIASVRALSGILNGYHPGFFPGYPRPGLAQSDDPRHNREYTPDDIWHLLDDSGFSIERLETGEFRDGPHPEHEYVRHLLTRYKLKDVLRGDGIYALGRKTGPVKNRWPAWLYY